ncbi:ABC transporter ATP-binding protein [Ramlibacter monticola]|uniref:ABC transporter ATP-binding protein n=1 Tax=Ramlibacter monticola TaxID=1926872 RepID=A0A936Z3V8_9BURK|nr:ABC transporter ATP-binding protein [Ramlibacter monticola]MBL0393449.1 ABC transporter ATP-binding protein [Ramlibacter monticola]
MTQLRVKGLSRSFGGLKAVDDVDFTVAKGSVHAVIGPNGAGKTTLFNLVTGICTPSAGSITFDGVEVSGRAPFELARLGMSRTFQNLQVCMNMSAVENVMVGAHLHLAQGLLASILHLPRLRRADADCRRRCLELMELVGLGNWLGAHASEMPYGALKRLEIARALASRPGMVLLDEPAAGLNDTETREMEALVRQISDSGVTVVLVEHDMKLVMNLSDHVLVLDHGRKLAEGTPAQVRANPEVIAAYLGEPA